MCIDHHEKKNCLISDKTEVGCGADTKKQQGSMLACLCSEIACSAAFKSGMCLHFLVLIDI